jgi:hypothetical protein
MNVARPVRLHKLVFPGWWLVALQLAAFLGIFLLAGLLSSANSPGPFSSNNSPFAQTAPTITPTATTVPCGSSKTAPVCPANSIIAGTVFLDGQPAAGFTVKLDNQNLSQTTGADGKYRFTGLGANPYTVRVIYDHTKYEVIGQDFSLQTVSNDSVNDNINFQFKTIATPTPVPTTAVPATFNPSLQIDPAAAPPGGSVKITGAGWNPQGPNGVQNQVTVTLENTSASGQLRGFSLANAPAPVLAVLHVAKDGTILAVATVPNNLAPQAFLAVGTDLNSQKAQKNFQVTQVTPANICSPAPAVPNKLRVAINTAQAAGSGKFQLCVSLTAPTNDGVNLNDTVIIQLPSGATASQLSASAGTVNSTGSTVRWGSFTLASQQNATLTLNIDTSNSTLNGTSLFVSGRFNRGLAFQQRINGLPALTEIDATPQGGGSVVPVAAPSTGFGAAQNDSAPVVVMILVAAWIITIALLLIGRLAWRKPQK